MLCSICDRECKSPYVRDRLHYCPSCWEDLQRREAHDTTRKYKGQPLRSRSCRKNPSQEQRLG